LNKNIWIGLSSPYGLSLKNIEIKREQTKYKNKIITKKNKKRKPNKPNTKQIQQTHHIFFLAWCYLVWAVQPIWFEKSTNKKKTNEIQKEQITTKNKRKQTNTKRKQKNKNNNKKKPS
jgi:hypothetical protein